MTNAEPFGVYIHWPFCEAKCPYCDFNSYARRSLSEEQYLAAALKELGHYAALCGSRTVLSIFFGGGTPSLMSAATVGALLDAIAKHVSLAPDCEITIEANPSSVEAGRFAGYRAAGVNRASLGVQALSDEALRALGRIHTAKEAKAALSLAMATFERVTFDLIYARPGQTTAAWKAELSDALAMARGHLSLYQLTIEPETAYFELERRGKLKIPEAGLAADLYELTQELTQTARLYAYEVSNHATPGEESRHNLLYWRYGDYIGVGPGAHGRLTLDGAKIATAAVRDPLAWHEQVQREGHGRAECVKLSAHEMAEETLLMGLRLKEGVDLERLAQKTGFTVGAGVVDELAGNGLIEKDGQHRVRATRAGRLVLNALIAALADGLQPAPVNCATAEAPPLM